jgi:ankyrin repeat protein
MSDKYERMLSFLIDTMKKFAIDFDVFGYCCSFDNLELIKYLVDEKDQGEKIRNSEYLIYAIEKGNIEIVRYLIENGCKIDIFCGDHISYTHVPQSKYIDIFEYLFDNGLTFPTKFDFSTDEDEIIALVKQMTDHSNFIFNIIRDNKLDILKYFVKKKVYIPLIEDSLEKYFREASSITVETIKYLLSLGCRMNIIDRLINSTDAFKNLNVFKYLLSIGGSFRDYYYFDGGDEEKTLEITKLLYSIGVDLLKARNIQEGSRGLFCDALYYGNYDIIEYLVSIGLDTDKNIHYIVDSMKRKCLFCKEDLMRLCNIGFDISTVLCRLILTSIKRDCLDIFKYLLSLNSSPKTLEKIKTLGRRNHCRSDYDIPIYIDAELFVKREKFILALGKKTKILNKDLLGLLINLFREKTTIFIIIKSCMYYNKFY